MASMRSVGVIFGAVARRGKRTFRILSDAELKEICKFEEMEKERPLPLDSVHAWQKEVKSR